MGNVLITGANGFIGSHVVREFIKNGIRVGCLVRKGGSLKNIEDLPVKLVNGDIEDFDSLRSAFKGFGYVVHIAAYARDWGSYDGFYNANVKGTLNVLKACYENGIQYITITSSNSVYGEEDCKETKNEESPYSPHYPYFMDKLFPSRLNYYRDTKALAKKAAIRYAEEKGINLTVIEPVWVYGEREFNTGFYEYLKTAKTGIPFLPGSTKNKFHVVYAGDLARAFFLAYMKRMEGVNSFIIGNEKTDRMDWIYTLFCTEAGLKKPVNLPKLIIYPVGFIMELIYTVLKIDTPPLLTRGRVNMFYDSIAYATDKAKESLGFTNEYSLEDGIRRTVKWYIERDLL